MQYWLMIFLGMSIVVNYITINAYIKKNSQYINIKEILDDMEKAQDTMSKAIDKAKAKLARARKVENK